MNGRMAAFGIGFVAGLRSMAASAALSSAASLGRTRTSWLPAGPWPRNLAVAAAVAEMAGDKMPFAPDRGMMPSFLARLVIGAVGGAFLAGQDASQLNGALHGVTGAAMGTPLGGAVWGAATRSRTDWARRWRRTRWPPSLR